jgi:hypothetical protein
VIAGIAGIYSDGGLGFVRALAEHPRALERNPSMQLLVCPPRRPSKVRSPAAVADRMSAIADWQRLATTDNQVANPRQTRERPTGPVTAAVLRGSPVVTLRPATSEWLWGLRLTTQRQGRGAMATFVSSVLRTPTQQYVPRTEPAREGNE